MINLAVSGAQGRMGTAITNLAQAQKEIFTVKTLLEHKDHPDLADSVSTNNAEIKGCDALIEFTLPDGTISNLRAAVEYNVPMVIGTTGFSEEQIQEISDASKKIPIVFASNMSIGVNILFKLIQIASEKIKPNSIHVSETHHIHKKDKPSGTAKTMVEIAEAASGLKIDEVASLREGEVIGDHSIVFDSDEDVLKIAHHARDRSMFAKGALEAAKFLQSKEHGLYNMLDVLGLN